MPVMLIVLGVVVVVGGAWRHRLVLRVPLTSSASTLPLACILRAVLVGGAITVAGSAWLYEAWPVVTLAAVIGGEELLETSVVIAALRAQGRPVPPRSDPPRLCP